MYSTHSWCKVPIKGQDSTTKSTTHEPGLGRLGIAGIKHATETRQIKQRRQNVTHIMTGPLMQTKLNSVYEQYRRLKDLDTHTHPDHI